MRTTISTEVTTILSDLVQINNDRIKGYEKAFDMLGEGDNDLKAIFADMIKESHNFRNALSSELTVQGHDADVGTTASGKIYRAWMEVKSTFTTDDRKAVLESCEFGEDAAQRAYKLALEDEFLPAYIREMIQEQKNALKLSHDQIKVLRDQEK